MNKIIVIGALSTAASIFTYKFFFSKQKTNEFNKVLGYILTADSIELNKILNICVKNKNIIIPNWYTWYDLMELSDVNISEEKWNSLHSRSEELSIQLNELVIKWIKN